MSKKSVIPYVDPASLPDSYYDDDDTRSLGPDPPASVAPSIAPTSPTSPTSPASTLPSPSFAPPPLSPRQSRPDSSRAATARPRSGASNESLNPFPVIPSMDTKHLLQLMKATRGRVRGDVSYRAKIDATTMSDWRNAYCYIKAEEGCLRYEPRSSIVSEDSVPSFETLAKDLYGCQAHLGPANDGRPVIFIRLRQQSSPLDRSGNVIGPKKMSTREMNALRRETGGFKSPTMPEEPRIYYDLELRPADETQITTWLAALLCWEPVRPGFSSSAEVEVQRLGPEDDTEAASRRASKTDGDEEHITIKVSEAWQHDTAVLSDLGCRSALRVLPNPVSCMLRANGELSIRRADGQLPLVIHVQELPRSAVAALDPALTDNRHSVILNLAYALSQNATSRIRPIVLSFASKRTYESWFSLLQTLAAPEVYTPIFQQFTDEFTLSDDLGTLDPRVNWQYEAERRLEVNVTNLKMFDHSALSPPTSPKTAAAPAPTDPRHDYLLGIMVDGHAVSRSSVRASFRTGDVQGPCAIVANRIPHAATKLSIRVVKDDLPLDTYADARPGSSTTVSSGQEVEYGEAFVANNGLQSTTADDEVSLPLVNRVGMQVGEIQLQWSFSLNVNMPLSAHADVMQTLRAFEKSLSLKLYERVPPTIAASYAATFLDIYQCAGLASAWFKDLIRKEILRQAIPDKDLTRSSQTGQPSFSNNSLFRDNSLLTRSLDEYMKRLGLPYLERTIGRRLRQILAEDVECEVDPSIVSEEEATRGWEYLIRTANELWEDIAPSASACPLKMRELFRYARDLAFNTFGPSSPQVYSSVTAFLFLRFFVPAIMAPHLWDMAPTPAGEHASRTLKQLGRTLNTLASLSEFGTKQAWMKPMNAFVTPRRDAMRAFIDTICDVPASEQDERRTGLTPADTSTRLQARLDPALRAHLPHFPGQAVLSAALRRVMSTWLERVESSAGRDNAVLDVSSDEFDPALSRFTRACREARARAADLVRLTARRTDRPSLWAAEWLAVAECVEEHPDSVWRVALRGAHVGGGGAPAGSRMSVRSSGSGDRERIESASRSATRESRKSSLKPSTAKTSGKKEEKGKDKGKAKERSPPREDPYENMRRKMGFI